MGQIVYRPIRSDLATVLNGHCRLTTLTAWPVWPLCRVVKYRYNDHQESLFCPNYCCIEKYIILTPSKCAYHTCLPSNIPKSWQKQKQTRTNEATIKFISAMFWVVSISKTWPKLSRFAFRKGQAVQCIYMIVISF